MVAFPKYSKTILYDLDGGLDQLGNVIGSPLAGDIVKVHMQAFYTAPRPLFHRFFVKPRQVEFLSTHMIGDTCFFEMTIPADHSNAPTSAMEILTVLIETMVLGEGACFTLDLDNHKVKAMFVADRLHHRAQWGDIPDDATNLVLYIDASRIVRGNKEHRKVNRNGVGGFSL